MHQFLKLILISILTLNSLAQAMPPEEEYVLLLKEYQKALNQVKQAEKDEFMLLKKQQIAQAEKISLHYREEGNIGFHLVAKNYANDLKTSPQEELDLERVQNPELIKLHQNMITSQRGIENRARYNEFLMMDKMVRFLQSRISQNAANLNFTAILENDLKRIQSDPVFTQGKIQALNMQAAQEMRAKQIAYSTPTPSPINVAPRIELDVFHKDNLESVHLTIQLRSKEMRHEYTNLKAQAWIVFRDKDSGKTFHIDSITNVEIGELGLGQKVEKEITISKRLKGFEYFGYVVAIKDGEGKHLEFKGFPNRFGPKERAEKIMSLRTGETFSL